MMAIKYPCLPLLSLPDEYAAVLVWLRCIDAHAYRNMCRRFRGAKDWHIRIMLARSLLFCKYKGHISNEAAARSLESRHQWFIEL